MGTHRLALAPWTLLALAGLALASPAQGLHRDEALGFEFRPPRGWNQIPLRTDESYVVGKYQADEAERALDPKTGRQLVHRPEVLVVAFLDSSIEGVPEQKTRAGRAYHGFRDFLDANYNQGFFVEEEEAGEHEGRPVTMLSIHVEGKISYMAKRIIAWEYDTDVGKLAVSYEVSEKSYREHRGDIRRLMRSFRTIPREGEIRLGMSERDFLSGQDLEELTPEERKAHKLRAQRAEWELMAAALPDGWEAMEIDDVLVVTHADKKHTREVVQHINNLYGWLEETFPEVGPEEHARPPLVRICKDAGEERVFREGSGTYSVSGTHLVTYEGEKSSDFTWEYIGGRTLYIWFRERDPELYAALPRWLEVGLGQLARNTTSRGSRLRFSDAWWEAVFPTDIPRAEDMLDLDRLFSLSDEEFDGYRKRGDERVWYESVLATEFFIDSRRNRELLADYLGNLRKALDEWEARDEETDEQRERPKNEEEEVARRKELEERIRQRERALLDRAFELTFGEWDRRDWQSLQRAFGRSL